MFLSPQCNATRDALAKALYCRTVATIVRRANSFRRPPTTGTMGSESTESTHMEVIHFFNLVGGYKEQVPYNQVPCSMFHGVQKLRIWANLD